ncbi:protein of unknown function [Candidatus Promineifilum breve]|uniref:Roadblock/LAMTOR2 domain-containing protein n=1 Tax=Candidatus Promineifilum breve TaxID=1806508 RepID=A0A160T3M0_9CHLR|nr:hypothetical protein [Candidatus Promineifilum breve]CUS03130.2 protein of unknown function [Candidatus Promineifilum breve]
MADVSDNQDKRSTGEVDPEVVRGLLRHAPIGAAQTILVARGAQLLAYRGALKQVEALDVAGQVDAAWHDAGQTVRIQFLRLPLAAQPLLLLIYPLRDTYRLILADAEDAPLEPLRKLSNQLLGILEVAGIGRKQL